MSAALIRAEAPEDRTAVLRLHLAAFGDHGSAVVGLLDDLDAGLSLVAEDDGQVVGHVRFSPGLLDAPRQLVSAYEPWMTGTFVYPDVFWRHDAVGLRRRQGPALVRRRLAPSGSRSTAPCRPSSVER